MPDDPKDFLPEPEKECRKCGDLYMLTDLNEDGLCPWCSGSEDEEDYDAE